MLLEVQSMSLAYGNIDAMRGVSLNLPGAASSRFLRGGAFSAGFRSRKTC